MLSAERGVERNASARRSGPTRPGETEAGSAGMQPMLRDNLVAAHFEPIGEQRGRNLSLSRCFLYALWPVGTQSTRTKNIGRNRPPRCLENARWSPGGRRDVASPLETRNHNLGYPVYLHSEVSYPHFNRRNTEAASRLAFKQLRFYMYANTRR